MCMQVAGMGIRTHLQTTYPLHHEQVAAIYVVTEALRPLVVASFLTPGPAWGLGQQVDMGLQAGQALQLLFPGPQKVNWK